MYILVTNDDGIDSEGLLLLKQALAKVGEVAIIAPDHNWSTAGHTKTIQRPLRVNQVRLADGDVAYSTDGTPSDCVSLGVLGILERKPDLVVAGINKGPNLGDDVTYSGTVAAAMEGIISGIPSIAISLADYTKWDFTYAAQFAAQLAQHVMGNGLGSDVLLNVNVPSVPRSKIVGVEITRLGKRVYRDVLIEHRDSTGQLYYRIGGDVPSGLPLEGTDFKAITENKISITPIHLDLTNHQLIEHLRSWKLNPHS
ncbi:MAG: 5'/3'-nucleotidase SurE [Chloroflexi bacterium]|nr:5'/3'-nucleotidase SurE [Chloroflexota bacterium]MDA8187346.1 5'/3'-nucleotidase SurE [Dehalococcoidales bacterium]